MNGTVKILGGIVIFYFAFALISMPLNLGGDYYMIFNWVIPGLVLIALSIMTFSSVHYKNIVLENNIFKKTITIIGNLFLIAITTFISWFVLAIIGFSNGSYSMSTYGTPIYRPKTR